MSPSKKNLIVNIGSNFFRIISTLIIIPFYIKYLGENLYSDWIVIFSISSLFEIANFGINQGVTNQYSIMYNSGEKNSRLIMTNGISLILIIYFISMISINILWNTLDIYRLISIDSLTKDNTIIIISFLISKVFIDIITGILCSHFFALDKNFYSIIITLAKNIFEFSIIIILLSVGYSLNIVAMGIFLNSLVIMILIFFLIELNIQKIKDYVPNKKIINLIIKPSAGFSLLTISELILNHGFIYIAKIFFSNNFLILWNTSRTLVNYIRSFQGLITSSVLPSLNVYFSQGKKSDFRALYKKTNLIVFFLTLILVSLIFILKEYIWIFWLGDSLVINKELIDYLLIGVLLSSFWIVKTTLIAAINKHLQYSFIYFCSAVFSVVLFIVLNSIVKIDYVLLPLFLLISHVSSIVYTSIYLKKII